METSHYNHLEKFETNDNSKNSNQILIAFGCIFSTCTYFNLYDNYLGLIQYLQFAFFSTLMTYTLVYFLNTNNKNKLKIFQFVISLFFSIYTFFKLYIDLQFIIISISLVSMFYIFILKISQKLFEKYKSIIISKWLGRLKFSILCIIWTLVTAYLPLTYFSLMARPEVISYSLQRLFLIIFISFYFEWRDKKSDQNNYLYNISNSLSFTEIRYLQFVFIFVYFVLGCIHANSIIPTAITAMLLVVMNIRFQPKNSNAFYVQSIDGLLILESFIFLMYNVFNILK